MTNMIEEYFFNQNIVHCKKERIDTNRLSINLLKFTSYFI